MAKIVVAKNRLPYPPLSGTDVVTFNFLRALGRRHAVTFVSLIVHPRQRSYAEVFERLGVRLVAVMMPNKKSLFHRAFYKIFYTAAAWLSGSPRDLWYYNPPAFRRAVKEAGRAADLVQFEYWYLYPTAAGVRGPKKVLLQHDAEFRINARVVGETRNPVLKFLRWLMYVQRRGFERAACRRFDEVLCLSAADAGALAPYCARPPRVVFPIVDLPAADKVCRGFAAATLVYFGGTRRLVNRQGLERFVRDIYPAVRREVPRAHLRVVGEAPAPKLRRLCAEAGGVEFTPPQEDLSDVLTNAAVAVVPLWAGAGIKIKILTACAYGVPVVTTPVGAEGIPARAGEEIIVAADEREFAAAVVALLRDANLWRKVSAGARAFAERETAPGRRDEEIAALYDLLAKS